MVHERTGSCSGAPEGNACRSCTAPGSLDDSSPHAAPRRTRCALVSSEARGAEDVLLALDGPRKEGEQTRKDLAGSLLAGSLGRVRAALRGDLESSLVIQLQRLRTRVTDEIKVSRKGNKEKTGAIADDIRKMFHAYLDRVPLPEPRRTGPDAVLAMDNLAAHKAPRVSALLDRSGFACCHLPAYSPDLSPIEPAWAKVKAVLRRVAARTVEALHRACRPALAAITPQDAAGFFRHRGYSRPK